MQSLPRSQTELDNNLNDLEHNFLSLDLFFKMKIRFKVNDSWAPPIILAQLFQLQRSSPLMWPSHSRKTTQHHFQSQADSGVMCQVTVEVKSFLKQQKGGLASCKDMTWCQLRVSTRLKIHLVSLVLTKHAKVSPKFSLSPSTSENA